MRVLVTGSTGFVGQWLVRELRAAGHEVFAGPTRAQADLANARALGALRSAIEAANPTAVAHLAAVAFGPDARRDPAYAEAVATTGTRTLFDALDEVGSAAAVLVTSSSEVYGKPRPEDLPLNEDAPTRPDSPYGRAKLGQESVAEAAANGGRRVIITRAFNHTGPGQRPEFVAPALARRVLDAASGRAASIRVGNLDVSRDIADVRDIVRAYRLLLEADQGPEPLDLSTAFNVATGTAVSVRSLLATLCRLAHVEVPIYPDPDLIRDGEATEIVGDASRLRNRTGWQPKIPIERTLADLLADLGLPPGS